MEKLWGSQDYLIEDNKIYFILLNGVDLLVSNILLYIILIGIAYIIIIVPFLLDKKDLENWVIRKYIHSFGLFTASLYGAYLDKINQVLIVTTLLVGTLLILSLIPQISLMQKLLDMGSRTDEPRWFLLVNASTTAFMVIILRIIFHEQRWIFLASTLTVAFGDGMGEFIGRPFGSHKYHIFSQKSLEGSIAVFVGCFIGGIFATLLLHDLTAYILFLIVICSVLSTIVEAFSVAFIDNLGMPVPFALILFYLT